MKPLIITKNVTAVVGVERIDLTTGQEITDELAAKLGAGKIASLINTRTAVPPEEFEQMFEPAVRGVELPAADSRDEEPPSPRPAWLETPMAALGLERQSVAAYQSAGVNTVGDALAFGAAHGSLTKIKGIGEATEKQTQEAISKIMPPEESEEEPPTT